VSALRDAAPRRRLLRAGASAGVLAWPVPRLAAQVANPSGDFGAAAPGAGSADAAGPCADWPAWRAFQEQFVADSGRVIDPASARAHTVSEAQGYALFFALVAGDRAGFERILRWTEDNLAGGDLALRLPAWLWGRRDDGSYGVIDDNSAADADLWLAYALGEAGRLWRVRRYKALSSLLVERVLREETAVLPGLGRTLLPGARGFAGADGRWRLNPSYGPLFLMRWLATRDRDFGADARWGELLASSVRLLSECAPRGLVPDWASYRSGVPGADAAAAGFERDSLSAADRVGSYDAVRAYLWLGLTSSADPARAALLRHLAPMADLVERRGAPPESVDVLAGSAQGEGPPGFSAALLPFLDALARTAAAQAQQERLQARRPSPDAYYDRALALFGLGWRDRRFSFAADGSVVPAWQDCPDPAGSA
jgi:endo-1,4-beta-D-glucanase Y